MLCLGEHRAPITALLSLARDGVNGGSSPCRAPKAQTPISSPTDPSRVTPHLSMHFGPDSGHELTPTSRQEVICSHIKKHTVRASGQCLAKKEGCIFNIPSGKEKIHLTPSLQINQVPVQVFHWPNIFNKIIHLLETF